MNQAQQSGAITAAFLLIVATGAVLYVCASASGRKHWRALDSRTRLLLLVSFVGWVSWVASAKVLRPWSIAIGLDGHWVLNVLPSFIAGVTVTAYAAFVLSVAHRGSALTVFFAGAVITLLLEVVQLWWPRRVFDPLDIIAGLFGTALITTIQFTFVPRASAKDNV